MRMLELALEHYGVTANTNPKALKKIFLSGDFPYPITANYCGIFMNYLATECEMPVPKSPQVARNWLKVGDPVDEPQ